MLELKGEKRKVREGYLMSNDHQKTCWKCTVSICIWIKAELEILEYKHRCLKTMIYNINIKTLESVEKLLNLVI